MRNTRHRMTSTGLFVAFLVATAFLLAASLSSARQVQQTSGNGGPPTFTLSIATLPFTGTRSILTRTPTIPPTIPPPIPPPWTTATPGYGRDGRPAGSASLEYVLVGTVAVSLIIVGIWLIGRSARKLE
ncbi:MAG: hypothetical protein M3328_10540 [Chloroflexota bacterium]|nr:hypothetical protein [Chloroflexota bacterium]